MIAAPCRIDRRRVATFTGLTVALCALTCPSASGASSAAADPDRLVAFARDAAHVVRGHCLSAEVVTVEVAGARLAATEYTFEVRETFKGQPGPRLRFRQVGTPEGGPLDLGQLVGLPVYRPGEEYVLFLLPAGRAGLTSPAGAGEAAFAVEEPLLRPLAAGHFVTAREAAPAADSAARHSPEPEVTTLEALRALLHGGAQR